MKSVIDVCGAVFNQTGIIEENMDLYTTVATAFLAAVTVAAVVKKRSDACVQTGQNDHFSQLPEELIPKIGVFLNKQDASSLKCVCRAFNTEVLMIKQPLKPIRAEFKTDWRMLKSNATIPAYMYDHVRVLSGHEDCVCSVAQLKDRRIVSGSEDETLRVWEYVNVL